MMVTWQTIITAAAVLGAAAAIIKTYNRGYDWVKKQEDQDAVIAEIKADQADIKEEQAILTMGILACLKGLKEQGADGPVTEAISAIEQHLNQKAHGQKGT
jgi:hypothetical protein